MKIYWLLLCLISALLLNCSQKSDTSAATIPAAQATKHEKPSAPVALVSSAEIKFAPGQLVQMQVVLETSVTSGDMEVRFSTDSAMQLQNTALFQVIHLDGNKNYSFPVQLIATTEGRYYLNLDVLLKTVDQSSSRNFNIILQVGDASVAVIQDAKSEQQKPGQENLVHMPATETVHTH